MDILRIRPQSGGAGVEINVKDNSVAVSPGNFGSAVIVGAFAKGPTDRFVLHTGGIGNYHRTRKADLLREDVAPLACQHFYDLARGKGKLATLRVTDGNEADASLPLFDRFVDENAWAEAPAERVNGRVGTLTAASPGTWGGAGYYFGGSVADDSAAISGSTFDTGLTDQWTKDELKGRTFVIDGYDREWYVTGNTAAGVLTVRGDFSSYTVTSGAVRYRVYGEAVDEAGGERALSALIGDGRQEPNGAFALNVYEDGGLEPNDWTDLYLDDEAEDYWKAKINTALTDSNQHEVEAADVFAGDPALEHLKPANFAEIPAPAGVTAGTVTFQIFRWQRTGTGDGYASAFTLGSAVRPHYLKLTLTGAGAYTVDAYNMAGVRIARDLPNGTVGVAYTAPDPHLSGHMVTAGSTPFIAGDIVYVYCRALPLDLAERGGKLYPYAYQGTAGGGKNVLTNYRIVSSTANSVSLLGGEDLTGIVVPPGAPLATGTVADPGSWNTLGKTFKYRLVNDGVEGAERTLTMVGANPQTVTALAAELDALDLAGDDELDFSVYTDTAGDSYLRVTRDTSDYGPDVGLKITTGTLNAIVGYVDDTTVTGATPTVCRVEWRQEFEGGKDGHHDLSVSDYTDLVDAETSPLLRLVDHDLGLVKVAIPGIDDAEIQAAALTYCTENGHQFYGEFPSSTADEAAAGAWLRANVVPTGAQVFSFPSYGYLRTNPFGGSGDYLMTTTGAILGDEAREASNRKGFIKPAANAGSDIGSLFKRLTTDPTGEPEPVRDYLLNPVGIRPLVHVGRTIKVYGDETAAPNFKGRRWIHKVACLLHIAAELRGLTSPIYEVIDDGLRSSLVADVYALMDEHFKAGWFKGGDLFSAVQATSNATNNTAADEAAGDVVLDLSFQLKDTAKRVRFNVNTSGITISF